MDHIIIWGTGKMAGRLMRRIEERNRCLSALAPKLCLQVDGFLDSNPSKAGARFFGKRVEDPRAFAWEKRTSLVIVAVKENAEILAQLRTMGLVRGRDFLALEDVMRWLYVDLRASESLFALLEVDDIHRSMQQAWRCAESEKDVVAALEGMWSAVRHALEGCGKAACMDDVQQMWIYELLLSEPARPEVGCIASWFARHLGAPQWVEMLEACYGGRVAEAARWMQLPRRSTMAPSSSKKPQTIGIYYTRFYNGGVERVLSKLIPLFMQNGCRIVLFTDVIDEEREYPLPAGVVRVILGQDMPLRQRCERILSALRKYQVDIYCCHANAGRLLYELFCVQQAGVPVMLELHNVFSAMPELLGGNLSALCRQMDAVVTLSRTDAMFWQLLGCRSRYIPNPVDPPVQREETCELHTILWLERVEQMQKQVFDLPEILEHVVAQVPDAKLRIVGASDTEGTEDRLRALFEERGLSDHVVLEGFHADVEPYYRKAEVMLITSAYEGFSMTIAESKKYGVPLVLYDLPYLELLKDGRGYMAVPQRDTKAAAEALTRILKDPALRERLAREAQASLAKFCGADLKEAWEEVFALAAGSRERKILTEEETVFSEIETLLLDRAERERKRSGALDA